LHCILNKDPNIKYKILFVEYHVNKGEKKKEPMVLVNRVIRKMIMFSGFNRTTINEYMGV
jgi:hypothetical protein